MTRLEEIIGYEFKDKRLCKTALTHSSYYNENRAVCGASNERLEFLGDSVLGFLAAEHLYLSNPKRPEGELTRMRASLVCEGSLAGAAADVGLSGDLLLGRGEEATGGRERPSLLADAMEALLGAIYLDGGVEPARMFVRRFVSGRSGARDSDYKTRLQEELQREPAKTYAYRLVEASGPDHAKVFTVEVLIDDAPAGRGTGSSKKEAEQAAAREALMGMGVLPDSCIE